MKQIDFIKFLMGGIMAVSLVMMPIQPLVNATVAETQDTSLTAESDDGAEEILYETLVSYSSYYDSYADATRPTAEVTMYGADYSAVYCDGEVTAGSCGSDYGLENKDNVLVWNEAEGSVTYEVEIPETGLYCMAFSYMPIPSAATDIVFSIEIDGEIPYDTASRATLTKVFQNDGEIALDSHGNELRPSQKQTALWLETPLRDVDGLFTEPLLFYMEQGTHEVTFDIENGYFALASFKFYNPEPLQSYTDYAASVDSSVTIEETASTLLRIEGEDAVYKSAATLYPTSDNVSCLASPADPARTVYNTIGADSWNRVLQTLTWEISAEELPCDGWYKIGIKSRQSEMRGFYSNRRIYIDGEVICEEMDQVKFYYSTDWQLVSPEDENGEALYIYLTGGQSHTITMEVVPGEIGDSLRRLETAVEELNTYYRKILMITGPTPDKYTDYYVHEKITGLTEELARLSTELREIQSDIEALGGSAGSEAASLERMALILDKCVEKPLRIPDYLSQIKDNITALSSWMYDYREQPLEVDYIEIASADCDFSPVKAALPATLAFSWKRFISSFFNDYTSLSGEAEEEAISVWVSDGREQGLLVKSLTESDFCQQYGISVSVNLVTGGILEATLAGNGPDVALFLGGEFPVNLAARGLLTDLQQFEDYDEVMERFQTNASVPYQYEGGCYGLPLSQSWAMLFYRKDILAELGFSEPPETWDDLMDMLPALQRNYLYAGLVLPTASGTDATISAATESGHTFAALLLQRGVSYYNDTLTATNFDSTDAVQAFTMWTDFYTKYGFEQTYDAFSRFRTGEYPLVIADYTFYNELTVASPEIKGLWDFTLIPGTVQEDGSVSHAVNSNSSGAVIFKKCRNTEGAWEFLKWFTSAQVQTEYGMQLEGQLGQLGRYTTANTEALQQLSWSSQEKKTLLLARSELEEIPVLPSSYAVTRNIMNAFRETVNSGQNPRDTLLWYNRDINTEITRKRENLGLAG